MALSAACLCLLSAMDGNCQQTAQEPAATDEASVPADERRTMRPAHTFPAPERDGGGRGLINSAGGFHATSRSRVLSSVNTESAAASALVLVALGAVKCQRRSGKGCVATTTTGRAAIGRQSEWTWTRRVLVTHVLQIQIKTAMIHLDVFFFPLHVAT